MLVFNAINKKKIFGAKRNCLIKSPDIFQRLKEKQKKDSVDFFFFNF